MPLRKMSGKQKKTITKSYSKKIRSKDSHKSGNILQKDKKEVIDMIKLVNRKRLIFSKKIREMIKGGEELYEKARAGSSDAVQKLYENREYLTLLMLESYDKRLSGLLKYYLTSAKKYDGKYMVKISTQIITYLMIYIYMMFFSFVGYTETLQGISPEIAQDLQEELFNTMAATDYYLVRPESLTGYGTAFKNLNKTYSRVRKIMKD